MTYEIERFGPCEDAVEFRAKYATFGEAWAACHRGDWMLWIAKQLDVDLRVLTLAKGHCAATVLHLMTDERSKRAVRAAIDFGGGKIGRDELETAANAAAYAAYAAAYAAANSAYAAYAAAYAAANAANAAYAAANAAANSANAANAANQKATADICRKYLTEAVMEKIKQL